MAEHRADIGDILFADFPLAEWKPADGDSSAEPWASFERARQCVDTGDVGGALDALDPVAQNRDGPSLQSLQAWRCLRDLGVKPIPREAAQILGVVLEVPVDGGLDFLAAYADHTARYLNHGGNVTIWDTRDDEMDKCIDEVVRAAKLIVDATEPWTGARSTRPHGERVRINVLTPAGRHIGEGTFAELADDPVSGPALTAGTALLQALDSRTG